MYRIIYYVFDKNHVAKRRFTETVTEKELQKTMDYYSVAEVPTMKPGDIHLATGSYERVIPGHIVELNVIKIS